MNLPGPILLLIANILICLSILVPKLAFCLWFAFAPFLIAIKNCSTPKALLGGLITAVILFTSLLYWIGYYELRILVIVVVLTLPFFELFVWLAKKFWKNAKNIFLQIFLPPIAWSAVSFLYSFTPIDIIGDQVAVLQAPFFPSIVRVTGIHGIMFLLLLSNSLVAHWIAEKSKMARNGTFILVALLLLTSLAHTKPIKGDPIKVALVQHNFPMSSAWRSLHRKKIMIAYEKAIRDIGNAADLIIFPQYGLPIDALRDPQLFEGLARLKNTSILLGTYIPKQPGGSLDSGERYDSALLFSPKSSVQEYRAITPPPFRQIGQIRGDKREPLLLKGNKMGVMLCYEDARSREAISWTKNGAEILTALSNPGHFLETLLPHYHLLHDRIRAIETGRYLIRVSPNGYSAIIDPNGKIIARSNLNEERNLRGEVYPISETTFFTKTGSLIPPISAFLALILLVGGYVRDSIKRLARKMR